MSKPKDAKKTVDTFLSEIKIIKNKNNEIKISFRTLTKTIKLTFFNNKFFSMYLI